MSGPVHVYNGPAKLADLKQVNLAGTSLYFNGPYDLRELRNLNFQGAIVSFNGQPMDESQLGKSEDKLSPSSPRLPLTLPESRGDFHPNRPAIDSYRPFRSSDHYRPSEASSTCAHRHQLGTKRRRRNKKLGSLKIADWLDVQNLRCQDDPITNMDYAMANGYANDPRRLSPHLASASPERGEVEQEAETPEQGIHPERLNSPRKPKSSSPQPVVVEYEVNAAKALALGVRRVRTSSEEKASQEDTVIPKQRVHPDRLKTFTQSKSLSPEIQQSLHGGKGVNALPLGVRKMHDSVEVGMKQEPGVELVTVANHYRQVQQTVLVKSTEQPQKVKREEELSTYSEGAMKMLDGNPLKRQRSTSLEAPRLAFTPRAFSATTAAAAAGRRPVFNTDHKIGLREEVRSMHSFDSKHSHLNGSAENSRKSSAAPAHQVVNHKYCDQPESGVEGLQHSSLTQTAMPRLKYSTGGIQKAIINAKKVYTISEIELRKERQRHGRASEFAVQRLKESGKELATLYDVNVRARV